MDTNLWLVETILKAKTKVSQDLVVEVEGSWLWQKGPVVDCLDRYVKLSMAKTLNEKMKSAERSIITYINEHEKVVKINSQIYSKGEGSDSPGGFRFKETATIS